MSTTTHVSSVDAPSVRSLLGTALVITVGLWCLLTLWAVVAGGIPGRDPLVLSGEPVVLDVLQQVLRALFAVGVAVAFVRYHGIESPLDWLGVRRPVGREWAYPFLGILLLVVTLLGAQVVIESVLGLNRTMRGSLPDAVMLSRVVTLLLLVGPAEESIFRGVIQGSLRESLDALPAILVAATLFGVGHVSLWATAPGDLLWLGAQIGAGIVLGVVYERTDNLVVTALTHGAFISLTTALAVVGG